uniref:Uncharacterized protein n=1 Tax=Aegilops tauschii subsp. strangulata TaxID=200361 RepID=A0A453PNK9_AEGTS
MILLGKYDGHFHDFLEWLNSQYPGQSRTTLLAVLLQTVSNVIDNHILVFSVQVSAYLCLQR